MIHFELSAERPRKVEPVLPLLTPDAYLELRRKAAGLSVAEAARRIATSRTAGILLAAHRDPSTGAFDVETAAVDLVRRLETPGATARYRETIEAFAAAVPLDVDVYFQLRNASVDRHPRICRSCGCSEYDACVAADLSHSCAWAGPTTCTRCVDAPSVPVHQ